MTLLLKAGKGSVSIALCTHFSRRRGQLRDSVHRTTKLAMLSLEIRIYWVRGLGGSEVSESLIVEEFREPNALNLRQRLCQAVNPSTRIPQSPPATMIIKAGINAAVSALPCHLREAEKGGVEVLLVASMVGAVSLSAGALHVLEKLLPKKTTRSRKNHSSTNGTCIEKLCWFLFVNVHFLMALGHAALVTTRLWTSYFQKKRCLWHIPECHFSGTTLL